MRDVATENGHSEKNGRGGDVLPQGAAPVVFPATLTLVENAKQSREKLLGRLVELDAERKLIVEALAEMGSSSPSRESKALALVDFSEPTPRPTMDHPVTGQRLSKVSPFRRHSHPKAKAPVKRAAPQSPPRASVAKPKLENGSLVRPTASELADHKRLVGAVVKASGPTGINAEGIAAKLGWPVQAVKAPLLELRDEKQITTRGQRRAMRYLVR